MALNINGTTGISGVEGSVSAPVLTGTDSNCGISFPSADTIKFSTGGVERMSITNSGVTGTGISEGKVLQVKVSQNTGNVSAVHNSSSSDSSQFGLQGYRTYGDLNTIQITPISATSTLIFQGHVGCNSGSYSTAGSYGNVAVQFVGDVSSGVLRSAHDMTNAQWYPLGTAFHTGGHLPSVFVVGHYALSNTDTVSWVHKGYSYEDGSGTNSISFRNAHFMIMEVDI